MKKFFQVFGLSIASIVVLLYLSFLFILPNAVDLNKFKPEIQKIVKEQANLNIDFDNSQISVTPLLSAGVTANNISVNLPDESNLLKADSFTGRISLPHLLFLTVKVSKAEIINPILNIDIIDGKAFKAVQAYEVILNNKEEKIEENLQTTQKPIIDPALIKVQIPAFKLINYCAKINDLKTSDTLRLKGDELVLGYRNGESILLKTNAELFINETKNINANIDIDTIIPQQSKLDKEDDKVQRVEIPFINPVAMYKAYDLKANIDSKIKIRNKNKQIISNGYFNIDNFTINLAGLKLPESKIHFTSKGTKANLDTDLYITDEEKISVLGMLNYGTKPATDIKIISNEIHINNVINLIKATLDSLHIKHELNPIIGEGIFTADTYIKTDFKKLNSNGNIKITNCIIKNKDRNLQLAKINSIISLDNSILKFIDTSLEIAETIFKIDGSINEKSYADISIIMEQMPLAKVFSMFLPAEINNTYNVNSGNVNLNANINGELKNANGNIKLSLKNLSLTDKVNKIDYLNNLLVANFTSDFKTFTGNINNADFKLSMNGANISCEKFLLDIGEKDLIINPSIIRINNSTDINIDGEIKDYLKNPLFNFNLNGDIRTKDLKQFFGPDMAIFIKEEGIIPINANLTGDKKKQTLTASIDANTNNYITPIDIKNVLDKNTVFKTVIDFKGDRLKIKDTGFFIKKTEQDPENPDKTITTYEEIIDIDGTITKLNTKTPNINLIKIKMPKDLNVVICAFPQSNLNANGNILIFGDLFAPRIRGEFDIWDLSIPELFIKMDKASSKFEGKNLDINIKNLIANGSDYNILMNADLNPSKYFTIKNLNLISNLTDADKLMEVSNAAMKYMPQTSSANKTQTTNQTDIPVIIKDGNIDIKEIKTGNITLNETTGRISFNKNILYINNLITSGFKGKIKGDVSTNILTSEIKAALKGNNLDVEKTLLDAAAMKDTLTGTMNFDTNISLKGVTYEEQMKTLKGRLDFTMKDGTLGPFGKIENLIMAENIRESVFFQSTIGTVINSLLSFDTSHYNTLTGNLRFNNGITEINPITSTGDVMGTYIFGNFDLLKNTIDIKLRGRLGSQVSDSMGPLSMLNPVNLVKATPGMSIVLGKMFALFCEEVTEDEIAQIPNLGKDISDTNSTKFQVIVRGDVAKPLTLIKSFKWLALQSEIENAKSYLNTIPQNTLPVDITNIDKEEIKTQVKEQTKQAVKETIEKSLSDETKESVNKTKETAGKLKSLFGNKETTKKTLEETKEQAKQNLLNQLKEQTSQIQLEQQLEETVEIPQN